MALRVVALAEENVCDLDQEYLQHGLLTGIYRSGDEAEISVPHEKYL